MIDFSGGLCYNIKALCARRGSWCAVRPACFGRLSGRAAFSVVLLLYTMSLDLSSIFAIFQNKILTFSQYFFNRCGACRSGIV